MRPMGREPDEPAAAKPTSREAAGRQRRLCAAPVACRRRHTQPRMYKLYSGVCARETETARSTRVRAASCIHAFRILNLVAAVKTCALAKATTVKYARSPICARRTASPSDRRGLTPHRLIDVAAASSDRLLG